MILAFLNGGSRVLKVTWLLPGNPGDRSWDANKLNNGGESRWANANWNTNP